MVRKEINEYIHGKKINNNNFINQGCITFIRSNSEDIYNILKDFYLLNCLINFINAVHCSFYSSMNPEKGITISTKHFKKQKRFF